MDTGTLAMALAVLCERSVREASRRIDRPVSSVGEAFERLEHWLALPLATRRSDGLILTLAGEGLLQSIDSFVEPLSRIAALAGLPGEPGIESLLRWAAGNPISLAMLTNFRAVVHHSSIRRAAAEHTISQPGLTRQMARLEAILGLPLLERGLRGCQPTVPGLALDAHAALLLERLSTLSGHADRRFAEKLRTVRLGTIIPFGHESRLAARLAQLVSDWRGGSDGQHLLLSSMTAEDLLSGLASGSLDLALTDIAANDRRFECRLLFSSELVLVGPASGIPDGTFASAFSGRDLVVPSLRSGLRQTIGSVLDTMRGLLEAPPNLVEVDTLSIVMNLVLNHGCITILPLDAVQSMAGAIRLMRLPGTPTIAFHLVWLRNQTMRRHAERVSTILTRFPT